MNGSCEAMQGAFALGKASVAVESDSRRKTASAAQGFFMVLVGNDGMTRNPVVKRMV